MSKLYFYYGVMNSSKTANLLLQAHSLEENEIPFLCLKSSRDTRDGDIIRSRIGIERKAVLIEDNTDVYKAIEIYNTLLNTSDKKLQWILVDEAQFLTTEQIDALAKAVDYLDVNVCCYGLRTDFKSKLLSKNIEIEEDLSFTYPSKSYLKTIDYMENNLVLKDFLEYGKICLSLWLGSYKDNTSYTLTYDNKSVTVSETNGTNDYQKLYYRSISAQFDTVLTGGKTVTITPHDEYATFYYGTSASSSNSQVSLKKDANNKYVTTFDKQEGADFFKIETKDNNGSWINYTSNVEDFEYDVVNGGYSVGDNETITIAITNSNFRVVYNGKYYYPQYTLTIQSIEKDLITVSNQKELESGPMQVQQYYVVTSGKKAYRYTQTYYVSGTFKEITYSGEIRTLPVPSGDSQDVNISQWAEGIYYTTINPDGKTYKKDNALTEYNAEAMGNLYFVVTSGASGGGGTGYATIDETTGKITLLRGFTSEHFVTVEIYQKVSGIDGKYSCADLNEMYLLSSVRLDPTTTTVLSAEETVTLSDILPEGTYYADPQVNITQSTTYSSYDTYLEEEEIFPQEDGSFSVSNVDSEDFTISFKNIACNIARLKIVYNGQEISVCEDENWEATLTKVEGGDSFTVIVENTALYLHVYLDSACTKQIRQISLDVDEENLALNYTLYDLINFLYLDDEIASNTEDIYIKILSEDKVDCSSCFTINNISANERIFNINLGSAVNCESRESLGLSESTPQVTKTYIVVDNGKIRSWVVTFGI